MPNLSDFKIGDRIEYIDTSGYKDSLIGKRGIVNEINKSTETVGVSFDDGLKEGFYSYRLKIINNNTMDSTNCNGGSLTDKVRLTFLKEPEKSFRKLGVTDNNDELTGEGQDAFLNWLFKKHQVEFKTEVVDPILAGMETEKAK